MPDHNAPIAVIGGVDASGSGHILHQDLRIARDVLAEEPRDETRVEVIGTAHVGADDEFDLLVPEEVVGPGGARAREQDTCSQSPRQPEKRGARHIAFVRIDRRMSHDSRERPTNNASVLHSKQRYAW